MLVVAMVMRGCLLSHSKEVEERKGWWSCGLDKGGDANNQVYNEALIYYDNG